MAVRLSYNSEYFNFLGEQIQGVLLYHPSNLRFSPEEKKTIGVFDRVVQKTEAIDPPLSFAQASADFSQFFVSVKDIGATIGRGLSTIGRLFSLVQLGNDIKDVTEAFSGSNEKLRQDKGTLVKKVLSIFGRVLLWIVAGLEWTKLAGVAHYAEIVATVSLFASSFAPFAFKVQETPIHQLGVEDLKPFGTKLYAIGLSMTDNPYIRFAAAGFDLASAGYDLVSGGYVPGVSL